MGFQGALKSQNNIEKEPIHLKSIFVSGVQQRSRFIFFLHVCPAVSALFIQKYSSPPSNCLGALVENQLSLYMWAYYRIIFSSISLFIPHILFSWLLEFYNKFRNSKKSKARGFTLLKLKTHFKAILIKTAGIWTIIRTDGIGIHPDIYDQLVFDEVATSTQQGKKSVHNWMSTCERMMLGPHVTIYKH